MNIKLVDKTCPQWREANALVARKYKHSFSADVSPSPESFFLCYPSDASTPDTNKALACVGFTHSLTESFFSEQYLDEPIEDIISRNEGLSVRRQDIAEIGSLASRERHAGKELIKSLPILIWCLGKKYVFCTASYSLRILLKKLGIKFTVVSYVRVEEVDEEMREKWGTYYENKPCVGYFKVETHTQHFHMNIGKYAFRNLDVSVNA